MGKTVTVKARGLYLNPNDLGDVPDGALARATNVVIGRDGIIETRRGRTLRSALQMDRFGHYGAALVGLVGDTLYYSTDNGVTWMSIPGSYPEPTDARMRFAESSGNLYFNSSAGIFRLDRLGNTPERAGSYPGMDCAATLAVPSVVDVDGTAVSPDSQTGYRVLFAKRDANNNVIFGAPSQRAVVVNPSITAPAGSVAAGSSTPRVVTVTRTGHGFKNGQKVYRQSVLLDLTDTGIPNFTDGLLGPITVISDNSFSYLDVGATSGYTSQQDAIYSNGARDVLVSATIPPGLPTDSSWFWQGYKTLSSATSTTDPGDEEGLVYEAPVPTPQTVNALARTGNVVTGTTTTADGSANVTHNWTPGTVVNLPVEVPGTSVSIMSAVSNVGAMTSADGVTWADAQAVGGQPSGPVCFGGSSVATSRFVAPGVNGMAVSSDSIVWSFAAAQDASYGTTHHQVAFGGANNWWVSAGEANNTLVIFQSSDNGVTWTKASITGVTAGYAWRGGWGIVWDGVKFVVACIFTNNNTTFHHFCTIEASGAAGQTWVWHDRGQVATNTYPPGHLAYGDGILVGLPWNPYNQPGVYQRFRRDGDTWTVTQMTLDSTHGPPNNNYGLRYLNGYFWAVGGDFLGGGGTLAYSKDGLDWTKRTGVGNVINTDIAYAGADAGGIYVMCGRGASTATTAVFTTWNMSSWTARTVQAGIYFGVVIGQNNNAIPAGDYTVTGVPEPHQFTFTSEAPDRPSAIYRHTVAPVSVGFLDTVPDTFVGAALYTSPGQETILQQNDRPVRCRDVAQYRDFIFWAAPTPLTNAPIALISVGGRTGLRGGDTVVVNGTSFQAATVESPTARTFKVFDSPKRTPSQNIADTATSLMRVVNRNAATVGAILVSTTTSEGVPGQMTIRALESGTTTTFSYTSIVGGTPWSPAAGVTVEPKTVVNELRWSKAGQADAAPELNGVRIGQDDKAIVRILSTRSSLFIFKEDGIYQLTGTAPPFQVDPFDLTTEIVGPETAVQLDNQVYLLSQNGIQRVSDTGTTLISRPIDPPLAKLLAPGNRPTVKATAFGVGDNADHKYYLWLPPPADQMPAPTHAYEAYIYDFFTDAFTHRNDAAVTGTVTQDDRLVLSSPLGVLLERKDFADTDYLDDLGISGIQAIQADVEWCPKFGQDPAALNHFQEIGLLFRKVYFDTSYVFFSSSIQGSNTTSVTLTGSAYGLEVTGTRQFAVRVIVPPEFARAGLLGVRYLHAVVGAPMQIQALSVSYNPGPTRFGR